MIAPRLSIVTLCVRDMGRMREFYRSLGWPEQSSANDEHAMFLTDGGILALYPLAAMAEEDGLGVSEAPEGFRGFIPACNLDNREAVDAAFEALRASNARIVKEPRDVFWGGYSGYFADPEGNYWNVAWNPYIGFDERGGMIARA